MLKLNPWIRGEMMSTENTMVQVPERNYGIDLLRIVSMFFVAVLHVFNYGGILYRVCLPYSHFYIVWFVEICAYCAVNCYALISGYVGIKSKFKYANILNLYLTAIFYTLAITGIFYIFVPGTVGKIDFIKALFPFGFGHYWYFTAYFCMFFFIPVFNHIINTMDRNSACTLIVSLIGVLSILPTIFNKDIFHTKDGYSAVWLGALYLIGAYISKYDVGKNIGKVSLFGLYLLAVLITWTVKTAMTVLAAGGYPTDDYANIFVEYTSPTILVTGVCLLLLFSKLQPGSIQKKFIGFFSPLAFSVYLIHEEPLIRENIVRDSFVWTLYEGPWFLLAVVIVSAFLIWFGCSLLDIPRHYLFKLLHIKRLCIKIEELFKKIFSKSKI